MTELCPYPITKGMISKSVALCKPHNPQQDMLLQFFASHLCFPLEGLSSIPLTASAVFPEKHCQKYIYQMSLWSLKPFFLFFNQNWRGKKNIMQSHSAKESKCVKLIIFYLLLKEREHHKKGASQLNELLNCCRRKVQYLSYLLPLATKVGGKVRIQRASRSWFC